MEKKNEQLREALGRLSVGQAATLARALELQRTLGTETLPTETVLDGMRPLLRNARPQRAPTICRLVCDGFKEFLIDRRDDPRVAGLIPRSSIRPWWTAIRYVAADQIAALTTELRTLLAANPAAPIDGFTHAVQQAAADWAAKIIGELNKLKPDAQLRKLLAGPLADDAQAIARILPMAQPIAVALESLTDLLKRLHLMDNARFADLSPEGVMLLKQHYVALSESHGTDACFLALAVMNRLARPCQILRLAGALSWKPTDDTLVSNTEFSCVGGRLVGNLQRLSREIVKLVSARKVLPPPEELRLLTGTYMEEAEALLNEIGFRRDSAWGEAILRTRAALADAFDRVFLKRYALMILEAMPQLPRESDKPAAPEASAPVDTALAAARFIALLAQRGQRHGFAQSAREALNMLNAELEQRANAALRTLQREPRSIETLRPQLEAAAKLFDIVAEEGRGLILLRQMDNALRASA